MSNESWYLPTETELKEQGFQSSPLRADDYICKIAKVILEKKRSFNNVTKKFDGPEQLQYELVFLPYKLKAEDGLKDKSGRDVKPLTQMLFKSISPFSMGMQKSGEPSALRAILAYTQGLEPDANARIPMPGIVILDADDNVASEADATLYKEEYKQLLQKAIEPHQFTMKNKGFKHITDLRVFEGKYISTKIVTYEKTGGSESNKITGFGRVPANFTPDATIEADEMKSFATKYQKMIEKRNNPVAQSASVSSSTIPNDTIIEPNMDLPF